jgi:zinc transporter
MSESAGLICAYLLDGKGGGQPIGWDEIRAWKPEQGTLWLHLDRTAPEATTWLQDRSRIDPIACEALLAEETRPRGVRVDGGLLVLLRGVNLHPGADPEDMVSIRVWVEAGRVVTLRRQPLMAVQDIRQLLAKGSGPRSAGDLLVQIGSQLIDRMGPVIESLDDSVDRLEEEVLTTPSNELRAQLADLRRQAIELRRYIAPQRDVLARLQQEELPWLSALQRARLREVADRVTRHVEDLDSARERAAVTHEEVMGRLSEQMNRTMYLLSIVATIFMPLGFVTGLLGINVAGIPGAENPWAFTYVCSALAVVIVLQLLLFRRWKWI